MPAFSGALATYVRVRHGIVSDDELRTMGISVKQRKALVTEGVLVAEFDRIYRVASTPITLEGRCLAICLARPDAVITGRAAGRLFGLRRMGRIDVIDVRLPHFAQTLSGRDVRLRRCNVMEPEDFVERPDGIRLVSPQRLAFDLGAVLDDLDLESVVEQILDQVLTTMPAILETGRRLYHPRRPGSARFARVIASRPAWLKPADSHIEVVLYDALRHAGIGGLTRQHEIELPNGVTIHPDIAIPQISWAIEVDHVHWHGGRVAAQSDKARDRLARQVQWQVDRVTDVEITRDLPSTVRQLVTIHHQLRSEVRLDRRAQHRNTAS